MLVEGSVKTSFAPMLTPELQVTLSPSATYARCVRDAGGGLWVAARRPLFVVLIQGVAIAMAATQSVGAPLVASVAVCWSATVLVQLLAAAILIASSRRRTVPFSTALDLFFLGHAPWSLWLLACAAALTWLLPYFSWILLLTMAVPTLLTARIVYAFAQQVLGSSRSEALRRTVVHQLAVWALLLGYLATAVALWPRLVGFLGR